MNEPQAIFCTDPRTGKRFSFVPLSPEKIQELDQAETRCNDRRKALEKDHKMARAYAKKIGLLR
jgi:hypothetical protein